MTPYKKHRSPENTIPLNRPRKNSQRCLPIPCPLIIKENLSKHICFATSMVGQEVWV